MLSKVGLNLSRAACRSSISMNMARSVTTKTHITDHATGEVIKLTDPSLPQMADYPNPAPKLAQDRDPYGKYDDPQNRRNLNEPLNFNDDLYDMWSPDYYQPVSDKSALKANGIFFGSVVAFGLAIWYFQLNPEKPAMPRSFPYNGLAKTLGSGSEEDAKVYRVKPDTTAEQELGVLGANDEIKKQQEAYLQANSDFIKA